MNSILIVIPTLRPKEAKKTGKIAVATSGLPADQVRLVIIHDAKKEGFTKTVNEGMRQSTKNEDICLLNDDISGFQFGWLETLRRALYLKPKYGISGPSGKSAAAPMKHGRPGQQGTQVVSQISFWCVLMKRTMLNELGYLDGAFIHYCSDNYYCYVMRKKGWRCVWAKAVYLKHAKSGSGFKGGWRNHDRKIYFRRIKKKK